MNTPKEGLNLNNQVSISQMLTEQIVEKSEKENVSLEVALITLIVKELGGPKKVRQLIGEDREKTLQTEVHADITKENGNLSIKCSDDLAKLIEEYKRYTIKKNSYNTIKQIRDYIGNKRIAVDTDKLDELYEKYRENYNTQNADEILKYDPITGAKYTPGGVNIDKNNFMKILAEKELNYEIKGDIGVIGEEGEVYLTANNESDAKAIKKLANIINS